MGHFPFNRLPRELRDRIYANVGGREATFNLVVSSPSASQSQQQRSATEYQIRLFEAPEVNMLLVSRDFKQEYEEETLRQAEFLIWTYFDDEIPTRSLATETGLQKWISRITRMSLRLWEKNYDCTHGSYFKAMASLAPFIGGMKEAEFNLLFSLTSFDEAHPDKDHIKKLLQPTSLRLPGTSNSIKVTNRVYYWHNLTSMSTSYEPSNSERQKYPFIDLAGWDSVRECLQNHPQNKMPFKITLSDDEDSVFGIKLEALLTETFDFEARMEQLLRLWRQRSAGEF